MAARGKTKTPKGPETDDMPELDLASARFLGRGLKKDRRLTLRAIRESLGVTQTQVSERSGLAQSEVSRIEQRDDMLLSTLRRYARALGGELDVAVLVNGRRMRVHVGE